jgi:hypothetical protein
MPGSTSERSEREPGSGLDGIEFDDVSEEVGDIEGEEDEEEDDFSFMLGLDEDDFDGVDMGEEVEDPNVPAIGIKKQQPKRPPYTGHPPQEQVKPSETKLPSLAAPAVAASELAGTAPKAVAVEEEEDEELTFDEPYKVPFKRDFDRFRQKIGEEECASLQKNGFVVIDKFLGDGWARALLQELQWLERNKLMKPNATRFAGNTFAKPHISETDLHEEHLRNKLPEMNELFWQTQELVGALETGLGVLPLHLKKGFAECTVKLQCNKGNGGCFPLHFDNPGAPNKRKLTMLIYFNPEWSPGDGGELQLQPFLEQVRCVQV